MRELGSEQNTHRHSMATRIQSIHRGRNGRKQADEVAKQSRIMTALGVLMSELQVSQVYF